MRTQVFTGVGHVAITVYKQAAFQAVLNGVAEWRCLDGLDQVEAIQISSNPLVKGVLPRCAHIAAVEGEIATKQYLQCVSLQVQVKVNLGKERFRDAALAAQSVTRT